MGAEAVGTGRKENGENVEPQRPLDMKQGLSSPHVQAVRVLDKHSGPVVLVCIFASGAQGAHSCALSNDF